MQTNPERAQRCEPERARIAVRAAASLLAFNASMFFFCVTATAQTPGPEAPAAAPAPTPAPSERQGFFGAFGNWMQHGVANAGAGRSEEHTSELQSRPHLVCRLLLEKKNIVNVFSHIETNSHITDNF